MHALLFLLAVWLGPGAPPAGSQEAPRPESLPLVLESGLLFLAVERPDGAVLLALLDTGASASAIDPRCAPELAVAERSEVVGTTGVLEADTVVLKGLHLGAVALPNLWATRRDLGGLLAPEGQRVDLILGSDALAELVVTIDFEALRLELERESTGAERRGWPMILDNGIPTIDAVLGGIQASLRIDTGASLFETDDVYVNIPTRFWRTLRERHPGLAPTSALQGTGADGQAVELPVAPLEQARIGPLGLERVFLIVQPEVGYFADPSAKGFVSNNFLRKLGRVTLDYRAGRFRTGS